MKTWWGVDRHKQINNGQPEQITRCDHTQIADHEMWSYSDIYWSSWSFWLGPVGPEAEIKWRADQKKRRVLVLRGRSGSPRTGSETEINTINTINRLTCRGRKTSVSTARTPRNTFHHHVSPKTPQTRSPQQAAPPSEGAERHLLVETPHYTAAHSEPVNDVTGHMFQRRCCSVPVTEYQHPVSIRWIVWKYSAGGLISYQWLISRHQLCLSRLCDEIRRSWRHFMSLTNWNWHGLKPPALWSTYIINTADELMIRHEDVTLIWMLLARRTFRFIPTLFQPLHASVNRWWRHLRDQTWRLFLPTHARQVTRWRHSHRC